MKKRLIIIFCFVILLIVYILGIKTGQYISAEAPKPIPQLAQPNMFSEAITVWANEAAVAIMSYDFAKHRQQMQRASEYFTPQGWKSYMQAFEEAGTLANVIKNKTVVSAVATGGPIILEQGVIADRYSWKVQIPLLVTYTGADTVTKQQLMITMQIQRTEKYLGKRGIGILNFMSIVKKNS